MVIFARKAARFTSCCTPFSYFQINGFCRSSNKRKKFEDLIKEFRIVYPDKPEFADALDKIRLSRNKLAHALIDQLGSDLCLKKDVIRSMRFYLGLFAWSEYICAAYRSIMRSSHTYPEGAYSQSS